MNSAASATNPASEFVVHGVFPRGIELSEIESLFRRLSSGVYVVGAAHDAERGAFTAAWVMQTSYDPLLLVVSINPEHATYPLVRASRAFTVNVLKSGRIDLVRRFGTQSGRDVDKLAGVSWREGRSGAPILDDALASFECDVIESVSAGDHDLVVGRVVAGAVTDPNAVPMTYAETVGVDGSGSLYPSRF